MVEEEGGKAIIVREERLPLHSYANLLWRELFTVAALIGRNRVREAYGRFTAVAPLLPKQARDAAEKELRRLNREGRLLMRQYRNHMARDVMMRIVGRRVVRKHLLRALNAVSEELEKLGYKKLTGRAVPVAGERIEGGAEQ